MSQILNYHDAVVYDTDVELFGEHGWLNDSCINWFFRSERIYPRQAGGLLLLTTPHVYVSSS